MSTKQNKIPSISVSYPSQVFLLPAAKHIPNYHVIFLILLIFILCRNLTFFQHITLKTRFLWSPVYILWTVTMRLFSLFFSISYSAAVDDRVPYADTAPRTRDWKASSKDSIPCPQSTAVTLWECNTSTTSNSPPSQLCSDTRYTNRIFYCPYQSLCGYTICPFIFIYFSIRKQ